MDAELAPLIDLGQFDQVDRSEKPEQFATWMDHQRISLPDRLVATLHIGSDDRVLDVGCGTGFDLAAMVTTTPWANGIDVSSTIATAASSATTRASWRWPTANGSRSHPTPSTCARVGPCSSTRHGLSSPLGDLPGREAGREGPAV